MQWTELAKTTIKQLGIECVLFKSINHSVYNPVNSIVIKEGSNAIKYSQYYI